MAAAPMYHLRVARLSKVIDSNVLWFDWCGYVYSEASGTYDLSIFLQNCAIAGALTKAFRLGDSHGWSAASEQCSCGNLDCDADEAWHPNSRGQAAPYW